MPNFLGKFFISIILFYIILNLNLFGLDLEYLYNSMLANIISLILPLFGISSIVNGSTIHMDNSTLIILFGCSGIETIIVFFSAVMSYKDLFPNKIKWLMYGFIIIFILNLFRITILAIMSNSNYKGFKIWHDYYLQSPFLIIPLILFFVYINLNKKNALQNNNSY